MDASHKEYLSRHGLLKFVAEMLGKVLEEKPEDPMKFMSTFLADHAPTMSRHNSGSGGKGGGGGGLPQTAADTDIDAMLGAAIMGPVGPGVGPVSGRSPSSPARRISAARVAGQYLEKSDVLNKTRDMLQHILAAQPEDPFAFMGTFLETGKPPPPTEEAAGSGVAKEEEKTVEKPKAASAARPAIDLSELMGKLQSSLTQAVSNGTLRQAIEQLPPQRPGGYATPEVAPPGGKGCKGSKGSLGKGSVGKPDVAAAAASNPGAG